MVHRGTRSHGARVRRKARAVRRELHKKKSFYDKRKGELINRQERYIKYDVVPDNLGFITVDASDFDDRRMMFLHEGEILIDGQGRGTMQYHPEAFR